MTGLGEMMRYPFPSDLAHSSRTNKIAWVFDEQGKRNVYVAEGPEFEARRLTEYMEDDGQEISSLSISDDGEWVVFLRGGEHGSNWDTEETMNPLSKPFPDKVQVWSIRFSGGEPFLLGEGANPKISPTSDAVVFEKDKQLWKTPVDASQKAASLFSLRGTNNSASWSPDSSKIAFVSDRGDHAYIGIYTGPEDRIQWIHPGFDRDASPRWSPDGTKIVFVRRPGSGGSPQTTLEDHHTSWAIVTSDLVSGETKTVWKAPETLAGSFPRTHGGTNLHWAARERIIFLSYQDGWPHLYSLPENGGDPILLTPGNFMAEYISLSSDRKSIVYAGNTGPDLLDEDRRHVFRVSVNAPDMKIITPGSGIEWAPKILVDGTTVMLSATPQRPPLPSYLSHGEIRLIGAESVPQEYPVDDLITPKQITFYAPDSLKIHAMWFEKEGGSKRKPAVVYVHGGPSRQMLLGWHYSSYYANAYATNQYLASLGFIVIAVNYRLGIGYGYDFQYPPDAGWRGASEYQDIKAAGEWLANHPAVDPDRIGIYGGSYGGYLTAFALAKDSDLFAVGVDIHGVHDRSVGRIQNIASPDRYEKAPDFGDVPEVMWKSSPVAYLDQWTSPVLIIHGDDDRNVRFSQSVDLVQRLRKKGVELETMVVVDDSHHFMVHENQKEVNLAVSEYLVRKLKP